MGIAAAATTVAVGVASSVASHEIEGAIAGGGGGGGTAPAAQQSSNGAGTAPFQGLSAFTTAGVDPKVKPAMGPGDPKEANTGINNVSGQVVSQKAPPSAHIDPMSSTRRTPSQPNFENNVNKEMNDMWADRLSKYLDYNTRTLG